jgi:dipeptide/tripeptide permease
MGFVNFFILNVIICVIDAVMNSFTVFTKNDTPELGPSKSFTGVTNIRWIFAILLPTINFKHALSNIQLHSNTQCISISNAMVGTKLSENAPWMSKERPGVGTQFIIFFVQMLFWWLILTIIENRIRIRQAWQRCWIREDSTSTDQWDDSVCKESYHITPAFPI